MLEEAEKAARNQGPKMNAMSRKILERKQRGESENNATDAADKSGNENKLYGRHTEKIPVTRMTVKSSGAVAANTN